jgi:DNA polymerase III subunit gamma/tau
MNYISFYRKWRPQSFDEIIGQEYNIKTLRNAISHNRLSHSYIFCGPRGTGKTSTARILAKALNCVKGVTPDPCNKCENCVSISNGTSVDVVEIDAASNRGINEIRELREKVKYLPNVLRKKVYIIDEVHMLTTEAFNALLKVLEEPPEHVVFILATTEPNKVIPTILSRCQRFDFLPIPMDKIKERLQNIAGSEKISISKSAIDLISKYADGSLRDADGILEQLASFGENKIEAKDVISLLGITDLDLLFRFTDVLISKNLAEGLSLTSKIIESSHNLKIFVSEFLDYLYDLYVMKNYSRPFEMVNISEDYKEKYLKQSAELQKEEIEFYMEIFTDLLRQIKWGEDSRVFFKASVIKALNFIASDKQGVEKETMLIKAQLESLRKEINKINLERKNAEQSYIPGRESTANGYNNQEDDFDIINTDEIDRMVDEVETHGKYKAGSKKIEKQDIEEAAKANSIKKEDGGGNDEFLLICSNLEKISLALKRKKISVYAMFVEAQLDRLEDGILYFSLGRKKGWHRDHLNKSINAGLISDVVREITGRDYRVKFEIIEKEDEDSTGDNIKSGKENKSAAIKKDKVINGRAGDGKNLKNKEGRKRGDGEDVISYFEKKFDIKE